MACGVENERGRKVDLGSGKMPAGRNSAMALQALKAWFEKKNVCIERAFIAT